MDRVEARSYEAKGISKEEFFNRIREYLMTKVEESVLIEGFMSDLTGNVWKEIYHVRRTSVEVRDMDLQGSAFVRIIGYSKDITDTKTGIEKETGLVLERKLR